ncbi:DNA polymerase lambda isoform X3 [Rhineura floridana]|uniref:DNA polymerase lambda isoform X3 n=1 Tax=Rhineura floridana TaxID=261503 RepID=UPI002AC7EBD1|nr:DNA polymerase lambda isoform X3 [Rhineura floridana]
MEPQGIVKAFPKRKKIRNDSRNVAPPKVLKEENRNEQAVWLEPVTAYVLQAGIGQARAEIFRKQIIQNGGRICSQLSPDVTHVIVDEGMDCGRAFRLLKLAKLPQGLQLVKASWLSSCITAQQILSTTGYSLFIPDKYLEIADASKPQSQLLNEEILQPQMESAVIALKAKSQTGISSCPCNATNSSGQQGAKEEACKIPGIGKQMAEKIVEILESGHLRKLDHISDSVSVLEVFSNIWGAGVKTSQVWYQQGFRTLDDIRTKASLTSQQAVGLKHYEDFLERMPRGEAAEIEQTVREATQSIKPGLLSVACGSFRRGKSTCGDVDVLVTHPDGHSHKGVFSKLLDSLRKSGFLTDDLVSQEDSGNQKKYLGVCRLPGSDRRHRRLDIIVVPYSEFACALLYFTGCRFIRKAPINHCFSKYRHHRYMTFNRSYQRLFPPEHNFSDPSAWCFSYTGVLLCRKKVSQKWPLNESIIILFTPVSLYSSIKMFQVCGFSVCGWSNIEQSNIEQLPGNDLTSS